MARSTGYVGSTATNPGISNCAPRPSKKAVLPCTRTPPTILGCSRGGRSRAWQVATVALCPLDHSINSSFELRRLLETRKLGQGIGDLDESPTRHGEGLLAHALPA